MTDSPDTIWANTKGGSSHKCFVSFTTPSEDYNTQYTRSDIAEARIAELEAAFVNIEVEAGKSNGTKKRVLDIARKALGAKT